MENKPRPRAKVLAADGRGNYVIRCMAKAIHLRYGTAILHFTEEGFWAFARQLGRFMALEGEKERLLMDFGPVTLCMDKREMAAFLRLVEMAACTMAFAPETTRPGIAPSGLEFP